MAFKEITDLTSQASFDPDASLIVDKSGFTEAKQMLCSVLDSRYVEAANASGDEMFGPLDITLPDTNALPVLRLTQQDLSEEMIEFEATVGVGNPVEAVGIKTLTVTHFIRVSITGVGNLYIPCGTIA